MPSDPPPKQDLFRPTWGRGFLALMFAVAGFFLPQEVPLEWSPLNEPGSDINYLEISCASDKHGEVQLLYDLARQGHRPIDTIRFPISPTPQTYTYTFPLPDAPIVALRVAPPGQGAILTIRQMKIINRRSEEIRRFARDMFRAENEIEAITPSTDGWKLTSTTGAIKPMTRIELFSPIISVGQDHRNLLRCLLSTSYLAMMLCILLLALLFTFYRPIGWSDPFRHLGFIAFLSLAFAFVGNRGLIRNSIHYARYDSWPVQPDLHLEFDLMTSRPTTTKLMWDTGNGLNDAEIFRQKYEPHQELQTVRFPLPKKPLVKLRFDPSDGEGQLIIRGIRVVDGGQRTCGVLPFDSLQPERDIDKLSTGKESLVIVIPAGGYDPITEFTPAALAFVNQVIAKAKDHNQENPILQ